MAAVTQSYDPTVVGWITRAAKTTGADPAALLATSIQESGARRGAVGDAGTSYGPFQFHRGGALGTHTPAWANSYPAVLNRAQEFSRLGVHGGAGAAAVQRPADRSLYATGVEANMGQAKAILAKMTGKTPQPHPHDSLPLPSVSPSSNPKADVGQELIQSLMDANAHIAKLPGSASLPASFGVSPLQRALNENAALAGIAAPTLPDATAAAAPADTTTRPLTGTLPKTHARTTPALKPSGKVIAGRAKIIGTPYAGTHTLGNWQSDNAVDIAMPVGTPIRAPYSGVIGPRIGSLGSGNPRFAGLRLTLQGPAQQLYMAHLSRLAVKAGQSVKAGQIIGYSGEANGVAHLHLGALKGSPGRYA